MTFETIKSFILGLLIAVSLLLTFSLWTYQPQSDQLSSEKLVSEEEMDIGGDEKDKKEIVEPKNMFFHHEERTLGFKDMKEQQDLYKDMQSWVLYDFERRENMEVPDEGHVVEVVFPDPLPMDLTSSLFTFNEEVYLPDWSFKRMYITFSENETQLNVRFESTDGNEHAKAVVNSSQEYDMLWDYASTEEGMQFYTKIKAKNDLYVPEESIELYNWTLTTNGTDPNKLVNALFNNPELVKRNITGDEANYTDGTQGMRVDRNKYHMEFYVAYDPQNYKKMPFEDVLERSRRNINEHNGWTDAYRFWSFKAYDNKVKYRMYYDDYPVFNSKGYAEIEQQWRDNNLYQYNRPMFSINNQIGKTKEELPSGSVVIEAIKDDRYANYDMDSITDIMPGYKLEFEDDSSYVMSLEPAWFMEYNGEWVEIVMDSDDRVTMKGRD